MISPSETPSANSADFNEFAENATVPELEDGIAAIGLVIQRTKTAQETFLERLRLLEKKKSAV
jgi:hypothetical protein